MTTTNPTETDQATTPTREELVDRGRAALRAIIDGDSGLWIDGGPVTGDGEEIGLLSPSDGTLIGNLTAASQSQVDEAVAAARTAFDTADWARDAQLRAQVLRRLAELVEGDAAEIAYLDAIEAGKVTTDSLGEDIPDVVANLRFAADLISHDDGRYLRNPDGWGWVTKVPAGVVGAILPWNYPIAMLGWKVAPALAAGNAMVIKTSEDSALSALHFARLAVQAGVPDGILNVITGTGQVVGTAMGLHNDIDVLTFTGSGPVGRSLLEASAKSNLKKVSLELGGRAGYIVDAEHATDFTAIADDIAAAAYGTSGQNCTAASRVIYVGADDERFAEFRTALINAAEALTVGDPLEAETDIGPVINPRARDRITAWVDEAVDHGAHIANTRAEVPLDGTWYPPTVIESVPDDSQLGCGEIFGPVTHLIRRDTRDEAVALINDEPYGLASSVWCEDIGRVRWWSDRIRVGTLAVNGYSEGTEATPFGGMRQSGFWGRDNGPEALATYQETMTVWVAGD
jgi:gamma-glutamyl-gamma-aminobutyraldehyde dehydrogenase